eukprot:gene9984-11820_t
MSAPTHIWKIALNDEYSQWAASGKLTGTILDNTDGFFHASDALMVRHVAQQFFQGNSDITLLQIDPQKLAGLTWNFEEPALQDSVSSAPINIAPITRTGSDMWRSEAQLARTPNSQPNTPKFGVPFDHFNLPENETVGFTFPDSHTYTAQYLTNGCIHVRGPPLPMSSVVATARLNIGADGNHIFPEWCK